MLQLQAGEFSAAAACMLQTELSTKLRDVVQV